MTGPVSVAQGRQLEVLVAGVGSIHTHYVTLFLECVQFSVSFPLFCPLGSDQVVGKLLSLALLHGVPIPGHLFAPSLFPVLVEAGHSVWERILNLHPVCLFLVNSGCDCAQTLEWTGHLPLCGCTVPIFLMCLFPPILHITR